MGELTWLTLGIIAVATFLMRTAPLFWMSRRLKRSENGSSLADIPLWLRVMGPMMIAAMFGTSLIPSTLSFNTWLATGLGVIATLLAWYKTRTLGVPVLAGVAVYGLLISLL